MVEIKNPGLVINSKGNYSEIWMGGVLITTVDLEALQRNNAYLHIKAGLLWKGPRSRLPKITQVEVKT